MFHYPLPQFPFFGSKWLPGSMAFLSWFHGGQARPWPAGTLFACFHDEWLWFVSHLFFSKAGFDSVPMNYFQFSFSFSVVARVGFPFPAVAGHLGIEAEHKKSIKESEKLAALSKNDSWSVALQLTIDFVPIHNLGTWSFVCNQVVAGELPSTSNLI